MRHLDVFIDFLISHSNAHLSYTRNDKDLCDFVWVGHRVDHFSELTSVQPSEILSIASIKVASWYTRKEPIPPPGTIASLVKT